MGFDKSKFYFGVNIPWLDNEYGHDMAASFDNRPVSPASDNDYGTILSDYFAHLKSYNMKVVRMWLLEAFEGLWIPAFPQASETPWLLRSPEAPFQYQDWEKLRNRIVKVMEAASNHNLQVLWCLLDGALLLPSNKKDNNKKDQVDWYSPVFHHLVNAPNQMHQSFIADILQPFLECIRNYSPQVFGIDIVNEIDWCWSRDTVITLKKKKVIDFATTMLEAIHDYNKRCQADFKATASFAHQCELEDSKDADLRRLVNSMDFCDFHRYYDPYDVTGKNGRLSDWHKTWVYKTFAKECIVGELGHKYPKNVCMAEALREDLQRESSEVIMKDALKNNYRGALLWSYTPVSLDDHRLLKRDQGTLPAFHKQFHKAAKADSKTRPFDRFERAIWKRIPYFVNEIQSKGQTP